MIPVGFLDDDPAKFGKRILGLRVVGATATIEAAIRRHAVDEVVIAMPTAGGQVVRAVVEGCRVAGVWSPTIPGVYELLGGTVTVNRIRDVEITDLLRRSPAQIRRHTPPYLRGQTVLVTGAGGSIGSELCRQVARVGPSALLLLGHGENSIFEACEELAHTSPLVKIAPVIADIRNQARIDRLMQQWRPAVVFHAAAHKHVPLDGGQPRGGVLQQRARHAIPGREAIAVASNGWCSSRPTRRWRRSA